MRKAVDAAGGGSAKYDAERLLSEIKRSPLSDVEVLAAIHQWGSRPGSEVAETVERERLAANQLHYDDVQRHAQRLLRIPAVARLYQAHFGGVLVDEFQDLSIQLLDLAMLSRTRRRTFAGDPLQGIYTCAVAAPAEVEAAIRGTCGNPIRLRESYRSSPKVLAMVNSISEQVEPGSSLTSAQPDRWPGEGCSAGLVLQDRTQEAAVLTRLSAAILNQDPTALYRHHHPRCVADRTSMTRSFRRRRSRYVDGTSQSRIPRSLLSSSRSSPLSHMGPGSLTQGSRCWTLWIPPTPTLANSSTTHSTPWSRAPPPQPALP